MSDFFDLSQEENSQESSSESLSVKKLDCFTISRRTKVKLFTRINETVKLKCFNKICDSIITAMFQMYLNFQSHFMIINDF